MYGNEGGCRAESSFFTVCLCSGGSFSRRLVKSVETKVAAGLKAVFFTVIIRSGRSFSWWLRKNRGNRGGCESKNYLFAGILQNVRWFSAEALYYIRKWGAPNSSAKKNTPEPGGLNQISGCQILLLLWEVFTERRRNREHYATSFVCSRTAPLGRPTPAEYQCPRRGRLHLKVQCPTEGQTAFVRPTPVKDQSAFARPAPTKGQSALARPVPHERSAFTWKTSPHGSAVST